MWLIQTWSEILTSSCAFTGLKLLKASKGSKLNNSNSAKRLHLLSKVLWSRHLPYKAKFQFQSLSFNKIKESTKSRFSSSNLIERWLTSSNQDKITYPWEYTSQLQETTGSSCLDKEQQLRSSITFPVSLFLNNLEDQRVDTPPHSSQRNHHNEQSNQAQQQVSNEGMRVFVNS